MRRRSRRPTLLACALVMLFGGGVTAAELPPACEGLTGEQRVLAVELLSSEHPYDCCDDTIARCLAQDPTCRLAWRLADNVCRRVSQGQDAERIRRALSRRARSMLPVAAPAEIDLRDAPALGAPGAPVEVVLYACARCPFCSKLVPQLHEAAVSGPLQGRARLYVRMFPIRDHEHSKEAALACVAAARQDRLWEYILHAYASFDDFEVEDLPSWAEAAGLDRELFERHAVDPATREALVASKKEGLVNGVEVTPTVFINGRKFVGEVTLDELLDVIAEEHEALGGERYRGP